MMSQNNLEKLSLKDLVYQPYGEVVRILKDYRIRFCVKYTDGRQLHTPNPLLELEVDENNVVLRIKKL